MRVNVKALSFVARRIVAAAAISVSALGIAGLVSPLLAYPLLAQQPAPPFVPPPTPRSPFFGPAPAPSPVERLGPGLVRIGNIRVDTAKKELSVDGVVNDARVLEFLANTKDGWKSYESALELNTNAVNFNVACLLIGLDNAGAVVSRFQFDPQPPQGHPLEMFIEWDNGGGKRRRIRAEQLVYSRVTKQTLTEGPWVYTGSVFDAENKTYMAETEGTLVGFLHNTAPIIESPRPLVGNFGDSIVNPELNLKAGATVTLIVKALPRTR
jgi:hypothetical protein